MALVVETTTTASANGADNLTINKPSGVTSGDLLLIGAAGLFSNTPSVSGFSTAASAFIDNPGGVADQGVYLLYRIADSSDVSASTYTIAMSGSNTLGAACMLRISGWTTGNPVFSSASGGGNGDPVTTSGASGLSVPRPHPQMLLILNAFLSNNSPISSATFSGYSITSSDSNPTWTEVTDVTVKTESGLYNVSFSLAYANSSNTSTITAYNTNVSSDNSGGLDAIVSLLAVLVEPSSVTASNDLLQTSPVSFATLTGSTQEPNSDFQAISPEIFTQSAKAIGTTNWSAESKPSTTWTKETI